MGRREGGFWLSSQGWIPYSDFHVNILLETFMSIHMVLEKSKYSHSIIHCGVIQWYASSFQFEERKRIEKSGGTVRYVFTIIMYLTIGTCYTIYMPHHIHGFKESRQWPKGDGSGPLLFTFSKVNSKAFLWRDENWYCIWLFKVTGYRWRN